jgi:hypothetical protein
MPIFKNNLDTSYVTAFFQRDEVASDTILTKRDLNFSLQAIEISGEMKVILRGKKAYVLSEKTELCKNNGSSGSTKISEIVVPQKNFEMLQTFCVAQIQSWYCGNKAQTTLSEAISDPFGTIDRDTALNIIFAGEQEAILRRMSVEMNFTLMFGDKAFTNQSLSVGRANGVTPTDENYPFFQKMLATQDGVWTNLLNSTLSSAQNKTIYFDTNDGTSAGNILNPANVIDMLSALISKSSPEMQSRRSEVVFAVDPAIMAAIQRAYIQGVANHTPIGIDLQQNFNPMLMSINFLGFTIIPLTESFLYGYEAKSLQQSTVPGQGSIYHEKNCRIIMSLRENIAITTSGKSLPNFENTSLRTFLDTDKLTEGNIVMTGLVNFGSSVIDNSQTLIGYASSFNFNN